MSPAKKNELAEFMRAIVYRALPHLPGPASALELLQGSWMAVGVGVDEDATDQSMRCKVTLTTSTEAGTLLVAHGDISMDSNDAAKRRWRLAQLIIQIPNTRAWKIQGTMDAAGNCEYRDAALIA